MFKALYKPYKQKTRIFEKLISIATFVDNLILKVVLFLFVSQFAIVIIQVIFRYVLHQSFHWAEEMPRYLLVYITFLGGSVAFYHNELVVLEFFIKRLDISLRKYLSITTLIMIQVFLFWVTRAGFNFVIFALKNRQISPAMRIPMYYVYLSIPIGFLLMIFFGCVNLVSHIYSISKSK